MASPGPGLPSREPLFQRTAETLGKHSSAEQEGGDLRQYTPAANTAIHDNLQQSCVCFPPFSVFAARWTGPERCGAVRERVARRRARFRETVARSHAADVVVGCCSSFHLSGSCGRDMHGRWTRRVLRRQRGQCGRARDRVFVCRSEEEMVRRGGEEEDGKGGDLAARVGELCACELRRSTGQRQAKGEGKGEGEGEGEVSRR
ncbi:uncharacterized protein J3D65DRAFT_602090 [Phyllosticta citribraziliensis]|uniref:Uncharacterized protein n=1 Tax=Phyllosticta citribraziliensis TaxID=989973 RepID=A0ABR1LY41_9PEZI